MKKITLPKFQEFLRSTSLVKEKYIPFYANWARKFLTFSRKYGNLRPTAELSQLHIFLIYLLTNAIFNALLDYGLLTYAKTQ